MFSCTYSVFSSSSGSFSDFQMKKSIKYIYLRFGSSSVLIFRIGFDSVFLGLVKNPTFIFQTIIKENISNKAICARFL